MADPLTLGGLFLGGTSSLARNPSTLGYLGGPLVGLAVGGADARNRQIAEAQDRQRQALAFESRTAERNAAAQSDEIRRRQLQVEGRLRVLAAFNGGGGGSDARLQNINAYEAGLNLGQVQNRLNDQITATRTSRLGQIAELEAGRQSLLLAGIGGAIQTASIASRFI